MAAEWIKRAQEAGWLVTGSKGLVLRLRCSKQGCRNMVKVPVTNLGDVPEPCPMAHTGQYAAPTFDEYRSLIGELQRRRRSLGLSQEDVCAASGLADAHINKLEAFDRTAQLPTLQLWAQTLGLSITLTTTELPLVTAKAIERRASKPYAEHNARFRNDRVKKLTHG